jgi:putative SOS response-associated peptidase YedK
MLTVEEYYNNTPFPKKNEPDLPDFPDLFMVSGFSHPTLPVVMNDGISMSEWGLIPSWITNEEKANDIRDKTLNAVGETVFEKPSFRQNIYKNRCLLPVSGFYEWRDVRGIKYPYFIHPANGNGFLLGSIYDIWYDKQTGERRNTFSIITTPANPLMEKIHNLKKRMPLILSNEDAHEWLEPLTEQEQLKNLIRPYQLQQMSAYTISRLANNARADRNIQEIMNRVEYKELEEVC